MMRRSNSTMALVVAMATALSAWAQEPAAGGASAAPEEVADLAKKAQNPVADLMIIPVQYKGATRIFPAANGLALLSTALGS